MRDFLGVIEQKCTRDLELERLGGANARLFLLHVSEIGAVLDSEPVRQRSW
ncbi:hypothetical protein QE375_003658 [Microbacterium foliorum]|uniref:Uncharacterized protein n=1 Tax=Microbacterium foliorum TaxID=104336 RepID=A0ABU1HXS6_9MICO|nr:hypothetical protein [Microbacterium foliorum]